MKNRNQLKKERIIRLYLSKKRFSRVPYNKVLYTYLILGFVTCLGTQSLFGQGQIRSRSVITVEHDKNRIKDEDLPNLPFDEEFILRISGISTDIKYIRVSYGIRDYTKDDYKEWKHYYLTEEEINDDGTVFLTQTKVNGGFIDLDDFPSLHPNEKYYLKIENIEPFSIGDSKLKVLTDKVQKEINAVYETIDPTPNQLKKLRKDIKGLIESETLGTSIFINEKGTKKIEDIDPLNDLPNIDNYINVFGRNIKLINNEYLNTLAARGNRRLPAFKLLNKIFQVREELIAAIETYRNDPLNVENKKKPITPEHYPGFSYEEFYEILVEDYGRDMGWESLDIDSSAIKSLTEVKKFSSRLLGTIVGRFEMGDKKFKFSDSYRNYTFHLPSLEVLQKGFEKLLDVKDTNDLDIIAPKDLQDILENLNKIIASDKRIKGWYDQERKLGSVLEGTFKNWSRNVGFGTDVVIDNKETPYIGLDLGYLLAPRIESQFVAQSVNFHLVPVNRNTRINAYKGWKHKVLKNASISIGIAQRIGSPDDTFESLTSIGSPFVGLGWRFNRLIRFNGGVLLYDEKNTNPIINDKITKGALFFSVNIDFKLREALGLIGNLFTAN